VTQDGSSLDDPLVRPQASSNPSLRSSSCSYGEGARRRFQPFANGREATIDAIAWMRGSVDACAERPTCDERHSGEMMIVEVSPTTRALAVLHLDFSEPRARDGSTGPRDAAPRSLDHGPVMQRRSTPRRSLKTSKRHLFERENSGSRGSVRRNLTGSCAPSDGDSVTDVC
jgi:hypothetical protein